MKGVALRMRAVLAAVVVAVAACAGLLAPGSAAAATGPAPWEGGAAVISPLELKINEWTSAVVERPAAAFCESAEEWTARGAAWGFVPGDVAGIVQFPEVGLPDRMFLSPLTCEPANEFLQAPTRAAQKCQVGVRAETRMQRYSVVVRRNGRRVRVRRTRRVVVQVPVYDVCDSYHQRIYAVATAAHEAMHVLGVGDEAAAECLAFQMVTPITAYFGASTAFAYEIGRDYSPLYDLNREFAPDYWSAECRDGGALDLFRTVPGWPTPPMSREGLMPRLTASIGRLNAQLGHALRGGSAEPTPRALPGPSSARRSMLSSS
jgi:hypothetical protein